MAITLKLLDSGADRELKLFLNYSGMSLSDLYLRLYTNNHTPACADTPSSYTECSLSGYAAKDLTGGTWTISTSSCVADGTYPTQTFNFTAGGQTIYGVYLTDGTPNYVFAAALLDTPFTVPTGGGSMTVDLEIIDKQAT